MIPEKEMKTVLNEFKKQPNDRNVKLIDSILAHLQFLINFDKSTRYQIY
jgi:hypothetical protein